MKTKLLQKMGCSGMLIRTHDLRMGQLNNEGLTGVCEADLDSTITQLLIRYLTGRPAYVSDPVIDTATNQIIYAHRVATNKVYGPDGLSNPLPLGEILTTIKVSVTNKAFSIHQEESVANVEEDKACRTKLAAEVDVEKILNNYRFEIFS